MGEGVGHGQDVGQGPARAIIWSIVTVLRRAASIIGILVGNWARHPATQFTLPPLFAAAITALLLLPSFDLLPIEFALPMWAPLPRFAVSLSYRYDALAHLFTFLAAVTVGSAMLSPTALRTCRRGTILLLLAAALVFAHIVAVRDLVALYIGWEASSLIAWLISGSNNPHGTSKGVILPVTAHLTGLSLLVAVVLTANAHGSALFDLGTLPAPQSTFLFLLLLLPAAARVGLFPFHSWIRDFKRVPPPVAVALICGLFAIGGPYLLARGIQLSGDTWPATWRTATLGILLAQVVVTSLLSWLATSPRLAIALAAGADLGVVLVTLIIGTPIAASAGLLLVVGNALSLAVLLPAATGNEADSRTSAGGRARRLAQIIPAASLIGAPPLLGFVARWQVLLAVWEGAGLLPLLVIVLATIPRSIALLRAVRTLWTEPSPTKASTSAPQTAGIPSIAVPAVLVALFSLLPWLPMRYLVAPAVLAITGVTQSPYPLSHGGSLAHAATAAAMLIAALGIATFYDPVTARVAARAGAPETLPTRLGDIMLAIGVMCHTMATLTMTFAREATKSGWLSALSAATSLSHRGETLMPGFEERYYLATTLLFSVAITLALVG